MAKRRHVADTMLVGRMFTQVGPLYTSKQLEAKVRDGWAERRVSGLKRIDLCGSDFVLRFHDPVGPDFMRWAMKRCLEEMIVQETKFKRDLPWS